MEERLHLLHQVMLEYDFEFNRRDRGEGEGVARWVLPNLLVKVGEDEKGAFLGIVREVMTGGKCIVAVADSEEGDNVVALESDLTMVVPKLSDDVKIVSGEFRHMTGKLVHICTTRNEGLVLFDDITGLKYVRMGLICKLAFIKEAFIPPELPPVILLPWKEDSVHREGLQVRDTDGDASSQGRQQDTSLQTLGQDADHDGYSTCQKHMKALAVIRPEQGTSEHGNDDVSDASVQREAHDEPIQPQIGAQVNADASESEQSTEVPSLLPQPD